SRRSQQGRRGNSCPGTRLRGKEFAPSPAAPLRRMEPMNPPPPSLGDFLRARRAQLTPREVGLPDTGAFRRVEGLRRAEVAQLAAISVDYYPRLERGRVDASASVLGTLARALRLDDDQQAYLYELAGKAGSRPRRRPPQRLRPAMRRLLD